VNSRTITVYQVYYLSDWIAVGEERYVKGLAPGVGLSPPWVYPKHPSAGFEPLVFSPLDRMNTGNSSLESFGSDKMQSLSTIVCLTLNY
jgi:hypothetical protein